MAVDVVLNYHMGIMMFEIGTRVNKNRARRLFFFVFFCLKGVIWDKKRHKGL